VPTNNPAKVAATKAPMPEKAEEGLRRRGQQSAAIEARRDVAGQKQIVDFEAAAERQQDHQAPHIRGSGQAFEPAGDFVRPAARGGKIKPGVDADGAHDFLPVFILFAQDALQRCALLVVGCHVYS
jgi:hypothetical protein